MRNGEQWEEFCRVKVILHVPHRSIQQIKETDDIAWSMVYDQHIETINRADTIDLLGQAIDREEPTIEDEDSGYEVDKDSDQEEAFRYDWMYLAEMGPNARIITDGIGPGKQRHGQKPRLGQRRTTKLFRRRPVKRP